MKKLYVDEILSAGKVNNEPGPQNYTLSPGFGQTKNNGSLYSIRPKNDPFVLHLEKAKKLPGPGNYFNSVDLSGKSQMNSIWKNQPVNSFEKANDRFKGTGFKNPAATDYSPLANLNQNFKSQFKFPGSTKFGQETRTFIDQNWDPKNAANCPAPG